MAFKNASSLMMVMSFGSMACSWELDGYDVPTPLALD
jgi:hypothetical protein